MVDIPSGTAAAIDVLRLGWQSVQREMRLGSDAPGELSTLNDLNRIIGDHLDKAYSKEVPDKQLTWSIKKLRELLFDSEDAIEDLGRPSSSGEHYNNRTFTVSSRKNMQKWQNYLVKLDQTAPQEDSSGLTSKHAQPCSVGRGSSSKALVEKTEALVGIEEPMNELIRSLTENPQKSKMIFLHGEQGVGKTSLVAAVLRHHSVTRHFKYCVWIEDLRSCELAKDMKTELIKANTTIWELTGEEVNKRSVELKEAFRFIENNLNNFKYALVLDDAVRADVFKFLEGHLSKTHPSVLVTTRVKSLQISSDCHVKDQYVTEGFEHVFLSENDSRSLFLGR